MLVYRGDTKLNSIWNNTLGYFEITGIGSVQEYMKAINMVYYKNTKDIPTLEERYITVTLKDADYLPATKYFYKFIKKIDITWTEGRDSV